MNKTAVALLHNSISEKAFLLKLKLPRRNASLCKLQQRLWRSFALLDNLSNMTPVQWKAPSLEKKCLHNVGIPQACIGKTNSVQWKVGLHRTLYDGQIRGAQERDHPENEHAGHDRKEPAAFLPERMCPWNVFHCYPFPFKKKRLVWMQGRQH